MLPFLLLCCFAGSLASSDSAQWDRALKFPEEVSTSNYVKLNPDFSRATTSVTVCTWMKKYLDPRVQHIWFSYAMFGRYNELMLSDYYHNAVGNSVYMLWTDLVLLKNEWYHFCVGWSASSDRMDFYVNGVLVQTEATSISSIGAGGTLVIGQDQDSLGGGFDKNQAFGGELYQLNVFSRKLRVEEIAAMYFDGRCSSLPSTLVHDVVLSWEDILGATRSGAVQEVSAECSERNFLGKVTQLVLEEVNSCRGH